MKKAVRVVEAALAVQQSMAQQFTTVDGHRILIRGSGEPAICVPTFEELSFVYEPLISVLQHNRQVILYSPHVSGSQIFGPQERAAELAKILDSLNIKAAHLIGWSDAGAVVTAFCEMTPARVLSRIYLGTPSHYLLPRGLRLLSSAYYKWPLDRYTPDAITAFFIAALMGGRAMPTRFLYRHIKAIGPVSQYLKYSILPCIRYVNNPLAQCATLVVGAGKDRFVRLAQARALADHAGAEFTALANGDHFLPFTSAPEVSATVVNFLSNDRSATTR